MEGVDYLKSDDAKDVARGALPAMVTLLRDLPFDDARLILLCLCAAYFAMATDGGAENEAAVDHFCDTLRGGAEDIAISPEAQALAKLVRGQHR